MRPLRRLYTASSSSQACPSNLLTSVFPRSSCCARLVLSNSHISRRETRLSHPVHLADDWINDVEAKKASEHDLADSRSSLLIEGRRILREVETVLREIARLQDERAQASKACQVDPHAVENVGSKSGVSHRLQFYWCVSTCLFPASFVPVIPR